MVGISRPICHSVFWYHHRYILHIRLIATAGVHGIIVAKRSQVMAVVCHLINLSLHQIGVKFRRSFHAVVVAGGAEAFP